MSMQVELTYLCRDIGHGQESGVVTGHFTGETDGQGKRVFKLDGGPGIMYLFNDEIMDVAEVSSNA